jgi:O-antigen ligase
MPFISIRRPRSADIRVTAALRNQRKMSSSMVSERKDLRWYYYYIVSAVFILQATGAFGIIDRLVYGVWDGKQGDKITQVCNLLMFVTALLLFWRACQKRIGAGGFLALALMGFLVLSAVWSIDPVTTLRRSFIYLFLVMGTIGIAGTWDGEKAMDLVAMTCGLCAAATIVLLVISPSNAWMDSGFVGIFVQKNGLGQEMAVGVLASLHSIRTSDRRKRFSKICALIVFIIIAFFSQSQTALMMIFVFCTISGVIVMLRKGGIASIMGVFLIMFLVPTAVIVGLNPDGFLGIIGKDPTLTGRTDLWSYVLDEIQKRPTLGWGFSAFWSSSNPAAMKISMALGWLVPQAHNALLEMLLEVGIVGAAFFLFLWARNVGLAVRCINTSKKELAISSLLCCVGVFLQGTTEPVLIEPNIWVIMFFSTGLLCEKAVRAPRLQQYPTTLRAIPRGAPTRSQEIKFRTR